MMSFSQPPAIKKDVILTSITNKYSLSQLSLLGSVRVLLGVCQGSVRGPSGVCRVFVWDSFEVRLGVRQVGQSVVRIFVQLSG